MQADISKTCSEIQLLGVTTAPILGVTNAKVTNAIMSNQCQSPIGWLADVDNYYHHHNFLSRSTNING